jgi:uncharacterized cupredoxin-like copper-binding protein
MKRKLLALLVLFVVIGGSAGAFAYWDNLSVDDTDNSVTIGNGVDLTIAESVTATSSLVPSTVIVKTGDVTEVVYSYNVDLNETLTAPLALTVTVDGFAINSNTALGTAYVNAAVTVGGVAGNTGTVNGDATTVVTVTITLTEPATQGDYLLVANQAITFNVNLTAN